MYGITIAFRKLDFRLGILNSPFCGLDNFKFLLASGNLGPIIRNTLLYNIVFIALGVVFNVTVAILFNEIRNKVAKKFYQTTSPSALDEHGHRVLACVQLSLC